MKYWSLCFLLVVVLIGGCRTAPEHAAEAVKVEPVLPDNEYCFAKIQEYRSFMANPANQKDGVLTAPFDLESYVGILMGRKALQVYETVLTARQCGKFFAQPMPEYVVLATERPAGTGSAENDLLSTDPGRLRMVGFYFKSADREAFLDFFRKQLQGDNLPRLSLLELFLADKSDYAVFEPLSAGYMTYALKFAPYRGWLDGLMQRSAGASDSLKKYISVMHKQIENSSKMPEIFSEFADWNRFSELAKEHPAFFYVRMFEEKKDGIAIDCRQIGIIFLKEDGQIIWDHIIETRRIKHHMSENPVPRS